MSNTFIAKNKSIHDIGLDDSGVITVSDWERANPEEECSLSDDGENMEELVLKIEAAKGNHFWTRDEGRLP